MNWPASLPEKRIVLIVQARMGATRLPGKPLLKVLNRPLLGYVWERVRRSKLTHSHILATTTNPDDDPIALWAQKNEAPLYRGSEEDVLDRYYQAAKQHNAEVVVRITADCPLIDPHLIDQALVHFLTFYPRYDYVSNTLERTYPRGLDVEVFSFKALEEAHTHATAPEEREHVTPYIYRHPEKYTLDQFKYPVDLSLYRWTVDTPEDLALITKIIEALYPTHPTFAFIDMIELLDEHPDWSALNSHISQKKL
ncbi:MAG: glycosyltransferase family protein [Chlamydiia bacterium]|nr:glycosyltransferase family protein [Chlamydiia bacterium]